MTRDQEPNMHCLECGGYFAQEDCILTAVNDIICFGMLCPVCYSDPFKLNGRLPVHSETMCNYGDEDDFDWNRIEDISDEIDVLLLEIDTLKNERTELKHDIHQAYFTKPDRK